MAHPGMYLLIFLCLCWMVYVLIFWMYVYIIVTNVASLCFPRTHGSCCWLCVQATLFRRPSSMEIQTSGNAVTLQEHHQILMIAIAWTCKGQIVMQYAVMIIAHSKRRGRRCVCVPPQLDTPRPPPKLMELQEVKAHVHQIRYCSGPLEPARLILLFPSVSTSGLVLPDKCSSEKCGNTLC